MSVRVRFAPSPTGYLHVGNVRTALVNWLFARKMEGTFILRIDDTDFERSKPEFEDGIREDMSWLGLGWEEEARQSSRMDRYAEAKEQLIAAGRLYPCYETAEELEIRRKMQISRGAPPIYDRAALKVTDAQKAQFEQEGRKPHWRFRLNDEEIVWPDLVRGEAKFEGRHASDPVLIREDGVPLYTLSSVVDDGDMAITHVVRGEDHVSNTAVQVQIFEAMGFAVPGFAHLALLKAKDGEFSKRTGGGDVRGMRERGVFPLSIESYLARIGTSDAVELADSLDELAEQFDFAKFGRAAATFDEEELDRLNARLLHGLPYEDVKGWLDDHAIDSTPELWDQVRTNTRHLGQVKDWWELVYQPLSPKIADAEYCAQAATLLPEGEFTDSSWQEFTGAVKEATGRKGKELFMPLRLALTAREDGPELATVFKLLGREKAEKRLLGQAA